MAVISFLQGWRKPGSMQVGNDKAGKWGLAGRPGRRDESSTQARAWSLLRAHFFLIITREKGKHQASWREVCRFICHELYTLMTPSKSYYLTFKFLFQERIDKDFKSTIFLILMQMTNDNINTVFKSSKPLLKN